MGLFKKNLNNIINRFGYYLIQINSDYEKLNSLVNPFTMTSPFSIITLVDAIKYVVENKIPGSIVECGVWKGGSMMAVAKTLLDLNSSDRDLYLFDTFEGMTKPTEIDISSQNESAIKHFEKEKISHDSSMWCNASLEKVKQAVYSVGYGREKIHFIKGKVEDTIPENAPETISLLRLDTDWYESTRHELIHLFPRLSKGGVIIVDDYYHWKGSKKATDEYILKNKIPLLLHKITNGGGIGIKI